MSGLELRVTNLEEQVGGIRETVAVIQTEQKYTISSLILTVLGGLLGNNAMIAMADSMGQANASETVDMAP